MALFFRNSEKRAEKKARKAARKAERKSGSKSREPRSDLAPLITEAPMPFFEEVFEIEQALFNCDPLNTEVESASADFIAEQDLKVFIVTLMVGLDDYLKRMVEVPTHHHKGMRQVGRYLEDGATHPIAFTQWNQSAIQGLAARMILKGRSRTILFGPALAMVRNISPYGQAFDLLIEGAHERGNIVYLLAIDGLAYAVFEVSHGIQEVIAP